MMFGSGGKPENRQGAWIEDAAGDHGAGNAVIE
jgi:hypothetical protein